VAVKGGWDDDDATAVRGVRWWGHVKGGRDPRCLKEEGRAGEGVSGWGLFP
jgi:hypothetical protein